MGAESSRIELKLDRDLRLAAAVAGAVIHVAERVGLAVDAQVSFANAAETACRAALASSLSERPALDVLVEDFPDRIEVTLFLPGEISPDLRGSTLGGVNTKRSAKQGGKLPSRGVDEVLYETQKGAARIKFIKYLEKKPLKKQSRRTR